MDADEDVAQSQASDDAVSAGLESPVDPNERAEQRPVCAWIDRSALRHNCRRAERLADGRDVIGVVKADAYGHGAEVVAHTMLASGVKRLAVVSIGEGARKDSGELIAPSVKAGDKILFGKWSGTEITLDGEELLIMKESDILGTIS